MNFKVTQDDTKKIIRLKLIYLIPFYVIRFIPWAIYLGTKETEKSLGNFLWTYDKALLNTPIYKKSQKQLEKLCKITTTQYAIEGQSFLTDDEIVKMFDHITDKSNTILIVGRQCENHIFLYTQIAFDDIEGSYKEATKGISIPKNVYKNPRINEDTMWLVNLNSKDKKGIYQNVVKYIMRIAK